MKRGASSFGSALAGVKGQIAAGNQLTGQYLLDPGNYSGAELGNYQLTMGDPLASVDTGSF